MIRFQKTRFLISQNTLFSWLQKFLAGVLVITMTTQLFADVPVQGDESTNIAPAEHDLVVILAENSLYSVGQETSANSVTGKIYRYAQDVEQTLPNTKVLVLPVSATESPQNIFAVLEKFYLEGQKKENSIFFLKGVVLFGNVPLPIVSGTLPFPSIFPYTDFSDPAFLWDEGRQMFLPNPGSTSMQAEIWHGVIRGKPEQISTYLDRNHTVHTQLKNGETPYTDAVLAADFTSEAAALSPLSVQQYELGQKYSEEKAYLRYNKYLLQKVQNEISAGFDASFGTEGEGLSADEEKNLTVTDEQIQNMPDAYLKNQIDQMLPEYIKAIGASATDLQDRILQSGRWSAGQVDTVPTLITALDLLTRAGMKALNTQLEDAVMRQVRQYWQRDVIVPTSVTTGELLKTNTVLNYLNGKNVNELNTAEDCTLIFGSPRLPDLVAQGINSEPVIYSRLYDPASAGRGKDMCDPYGGCCIANSQSPARCEPEKATRPVFSTGGNAVATSLTKSANFRLCQSLSAFAAENKSGTPLTTESKKISSVFLHDAPRSDQISSALEHPTAGNIPSDGVQFVNFQGPSGNLQKVEFLNAFKFQAGPNEEGDILWTKFLDFVRQKQSEIEAKIIADNLVLFAQYTYLKTRSFSDHAAIDLTPPDDFWPSFFAYRRDMETFLRQKFPGKASLPELWLAAARSQDQPLGSASTEIFQRHFTFAQNGVSGPELPDIFAFWKQETEQKYDVTLSGSVDSFTLARNALWGVQGHTQTFPFRPVALPAPDFLIQKTQESASPLLTVLLHWQNLNADEKHAEAVQLFFNADNTFLPRGRQKGVALAYFRGNGDTNHLFWTGPQNTDQDAQWDALRLAAQTPQNILTDNTVDGDGANSDPSQTVCAPVEGAEIWQWLPAVKCWLDSFKKLGVQMKRICGLVTGASPLGDLPARDRQTGDLVSALSREDPTKIAFTAAPQVLMPEMETTVTGEFHDAENLPTAAGSGVVTLTLTGPGEILTADTDPQTAGFQVPVASGSFQVDLKGHTVGTLKLTVSADGLGPQEFLVSVVPQLKLDLQNLPTTEHQGSLSLAQVEIAVRDDRNVLRTDFSGTATVSVTDPSSAMLSTPQVEITNGKGIIALAVISGPVDLQVTLPPLPAVHFTVEQNNTNSERPVALLFDQAPHYLNLSSEIRIPLKVLMSSGRVSTQTTDYPADLKIGFTDATKNLAEVERQGNSVVLKGGRKAGLLHLFGQGGGLQPALQEIQLGAAIGPDELAKLTPNSLITQFFGAATADPLNAENLAADVLFSGKTAAVSGLTTAGMLKAPQAKVFSNGQVELGDENLTTIVSKLEPLQLKIFDPAEFRSLAEFAPTLDPAAKLEIAAPETNAAGLYFENLESSGGLTAEIKTDQIHISLEGREVLSVGKDLAFHSQDQRFSLEPEVNPKGNGIILKFLLDGETELGRFTLIASGITLLNAIQSQPMSGGGFFLPGDTTAEDVALLPNTDSAVAQDADGVGWQDQALGDLHLAAGQTIGEALQSMADPLLLTWGDPTISLTPPVTSGSGFDNTIGTEVFSAPAADIENVLASDLDGDGQKDLLVQQTGGTLRFLQNTGNGAFRDWGDALRLGRGIADAVAQSMKTGFSNLLVRDGEGTENFIQNAQEVLTLGALDILKKGVTTMNSADLDQDGFDDLIVAFNDGEMRIFYGSAEGYSQQNSLFLDRIGGSISGENSAGEMYFSTDASTNGNTVSFPDPRKGSSADATTTTQLFRVLQENNLGITRLSRDENGGVLAENDTVDVTITIPAQAQRFHVISPIPESLSYDEASLSCPDCDTGTLFLPPSGESGAFLQVWNIPAGKKITITYTLHASVVPEITFVPQKLNDPAFLQDDILDIALFIPGATADGVLTFVSTGKRNYKEVVRPQETSPTPDSLADRNGNGVPDSMEADENHDGIPDAVQDTLNSWKGDSDGDGLPDSWDSVVSGSHGLFTSPEPGSKPDQNLDTLNKNLDDAVKKVYDSTCANGGCVASPINLAFLVPGQTNVTQALATAALATLQGAAAPALQFAGILNMFSGGALGPALNGFQSRLQSTLGPLVGGEGQRGPDLQDAFPIFGTHTSTTGVSPCSGKSCTNPVNGPLGIFRFYISPTVTGGTGIAICLGPYMAGRCFATGVPLLAQTGVCDKINAAITNLFAQANRAVSSQNAGHVAFVVDAGKGPKSRAGAVEVTFSQGLMRWNSAAGHNVVPESSPSWFARWVSAQIDEVKKMFTLPAFTLIYPDLSRSLSNRNEVKTPPASAAKPVVTPKPAAKNSAYDRLEPITSAVTAANKQLSSIEDIYNTLRTIPLLDIDEEVIAVSVPNISRKTVFAILDDLQNWKDAATKELADWQNFVANWQCPKGLPAADCTKAKLAWQKMQGQVKISYQGLLTSIQQNIETLQEYTDFYNIIAHYDEELAKYVNGIICYVDAVTDLMGGWFRTNLVWAKSWIRFYKTVKMIKENWAKLFQLPDLARKSCPACQADKYTTGGSTFELLANFLPTPPVITFPKLPDIVLDISQIKAALHVKVPRLEFHPVEVPFPQLPALRLPRVPTVTVVLPHLPLLPKLPPLPTLPDFPSLPIPQLPTLPPPPKLPEVSANLQKIIKAVSKILKLYCLFKQGIWMYPEYDLRPVIETLTNRPASVLLNIDFLDLAFPDISLPTVDEIRVTAQVNLSLSFENILTSIKEQVKKWNDLVFQKKEALLEEMNTKFDFGNALDFRYTIPENITVDPQRNGTGGGDTAAPRDRIPATPVDPLQKTDTKSPLSSMLPQFFAEMTTLSASGKLVNADQLATAYGIPEPVLPGFETSPAARNFQKLHTALNDIAENALQERSQLLGSKETAILLKTDPTPKGINRGSAQWASPENIPAVHPLVPFSPEAASTAPSPFGSLESDTPALPVATTENTQKGIFVFDPELKQAEKVVTYSGFDDTVRNLVFARITSADADDLVIVTPEKILLKRGKSAPKVQNFLTIPPEVGAFQNFIPALDAVKNVTIEQAAGKVTVNFPELDRNDLAGVEIILKNTATGFVRPNATQTKYVELLFPEYLQQELEPNKFFNGPRTLSVAGSTLDVGENAAVLLAPLQAPTFELPLESGFWTVKMRWLLSDGKKGTLSESHLAAPDVKNDQTPPLFLGDNVRKIPVLTTTQISAEGMFDLQSGMQFSWDLDGDGKGDASGYQIPIGPYPLPEKRQIFLSATDAGGNVLRVPITLDIYVPNISLDEATVTPQHVSGEVDPHLPQFPFALLRKRLETWKLIKTPSADTNGRYLTDGQGKFTVSDLDTSPDALVKDNAGKVIARVSGRNGRISLLQPGYHLEAVPGDGKLFPRTLIVNDQNIIVANVIFRTDEKSDVFLSTVPITADNAKGFSGVTAVDRNPADSVQFLGLPVDAPSFPGGAAFVDQNTGNVLAMISRAGDIRLLQTGITMRLKASTDPVNDPVLLEILNGPNILFDLYIPTDFAHILLHPGENITTKTSTVAAETPTHVFAAAATPIQKTTTSPFPDVPTTHPYAAAITDLAARGIIKGYSDGLFRPDQRISRAEFVKIVLGATSCADCTTPTPFQWKLFFEPYPFPDVDFGAWYAFCVSMGKKLGIVQGYGDGLFGPNKNITRAEAVAVLLRAAKIPLQEKLTGGDTLRDVPPDAWYFKDVITAVNMGLIPLRTGGFVLPEEQITRGEFAFLAGKVLEFADCKVLDSDGDGIPDYQEIANVLDEHDPNDAAADSDGDGISNADEIRAGTDPHTAQNAPAPVSGNICSRFPKIGNNVSFQDGCPVVPTSSFSGDPGVHIYPGDPNICGFLDYAADLRSGDVVKAAILNASNTQILSASTEVKITP